MALKFQGGQAKPATRHQFVLSAPLANSQNAMTMYGEQDELAAIERKVKAKFPGTRTQMSQMSSGRWELMVWEGSILATALRGIIPGV